MITSEHLPVQTRIRRLYRLYTVLDINLVARALGLPHVQVATAMNHLRRRRAVRRIDARLARRPYVRVQYALEVPAC